MEMRMIPSSLARIRLRPTSLEIQRQRGFRTLLRFAGAAALESPWRRCRILPADGEPVPRTRSLTVARTAAEALADHVALEVEPSAASSSMPTSPRCWAPAAPPASSANCLGLPMHSTALMDPMLSAFGGSIEAFARGLDVIPCRRGERKDDRRQARLRQRLGGEAGRRRRGLGTGAQAEHAAQPADGGEPAPGAALPPHPRPGAPTDAGGCCGPAAPCSGSSTFRAGTRRPLEGPIGCRLDLTQASSSAGEKESLTLRFLWPMGSIGRNSR